MLERISCSQPIRNSIQRMVRWGIVSNLRRIPTDCNQRDERVGWMADAYLYAESAMHHFDMATYFTMRRLRSIRDEQAEDSPLPDTTPRARFIRWSAGMTTAPANQFPGYAGAP